VVLLCLTSQTVERRGAELDTVLEAIDCCLRAKEVKQLLVQKAPGKSSKVTRVALLVVSHAVLCIVCSTGLMALI
jgi:hypothetical protein